jgi:aerobic carbon-monoxide dehydrogenase medium subunit
VDASLRLALGGVAGTPVRSAAAEAVLAGGPLSPARIGEAAEAAAREIQPGGDIHATAAYRRQLTRVLVTRALTQATGIQAA